MALGCCWTVGSAAVVVDGAGKRQLLPNGDAIVETTVRNARYCDRDGPCELTFKIGARTGAVVYARGDVGGAKPCEKSLVNAAWNIQDCSFAR